MASSLLAAFLLLSSYAVVSVGSSRTIAGEVDQTNWSAAKVATATMKATMKADGGRGAAARYLVAERSIGGMVPGREPVTMVRRSPWSPPSPIGHVPVSWEKGMPPCGVGCY